MGKSTLPYETTTVSVGASQESIEKLLEKHGITKTQWTSDKETLVQLAFIYESSGRKIAFRIAIPYLTKKVGRNKEEVRVLRESTMRMLFYFIKSKLEAIKFGIESIEEAFLAHIIVDSNRTLKDVYLSQLPQFNVQFLPESSTGDEGK
jgi:hypothetical protein